MLDVHILRHPRYEPWKLERCLQSCASEHADVRVLPGHDGHIGRGRVEGFSTGDQPFVTYVDDDDMLVPGTLDLLVGLLSQTPEAVFAYVPNRRAPEHAPLPEAVTSAQHRVTTKRRSPPVFVDHMCIYRWDRLEKMLPEYQRWRRGGDSRIMRQYIDQKVGDDEPIIVVLEPLYRFCEG